MYAEKDEAVNSLVEFAHYREAEGKLTQYFRPSDDYPSLQVLKNSVSKSMELHDEDIYRITILPLTPKSTDMVDDYKVPGIYGDGWGISCHIS